MTNKTGDLTEKEVAMLRKIQTSEYHNGNDPINNPVWLSCVCRSMSDGGVITSLNKKGLVGLQSGDDDLVWLTMAGATFLMLAGPAESEASR